MNDRDSYYERIKALVGDRLTEKRVEVLGTGFLSKAVELLASCGIVKFNFCASMRTSFGNTAPAAVGLISYLESHNQFEDRWEFGHLDNGEPDLILGGNGLDHCRLACHKARYKKIPCVLAWRSKSGLTMIMVVSPGEEDFSLGFLEKMDDGSKEISYIDLVDLNNQVANVAKAILLKGSQWERKDFNNLFSAGRNLIIVNHPTWPWAGKFLNPKDPEDIKLLEYRSPNFSSLKIHDLRGRKVMVVGLGSLGSIAADHFRVLGASVIGIDFKEVSLYNPVRQLYSTSCVGLPKSQVLPTTLTLREGRFEEILEHTDKRLIIKIKDGRRFTGIDEKIEDSREGQKKFEELVDEFKPDLVMLATAHQSEFRMAHVLRERGILHIIARCYRRAKWFEVTAVDGAGGPCFGCLQGHLYTGVAPSIELTEEEQTHYDGTVRLDKMVEAEPATRIDTSRSADAATRLACELLASAEKRSEWFRKMMSEERNCLIGGNTAEFREKENDWAYGIASPGSATIYGVINFVGSETEKEKTCLYCGRTHEVLIHRAPTPTS
ncbi:MAG: ThiF family adenylyltransferase [bacterium]|nr:ThiF family adenylyltransferase [bacterium]